MFKLTDRNSIEIFGRAAWYKIKMMFIAIPVRIPISSCNARHAMKAAIPGIKSVSKYEEKLNEFKNVDEFENFGKEELTFTTPHGFHNPNLYHKYDGCNNYTGQCSFWNVIEQWSHKK